MSRQFLDPFREVARRSLLLLPIMVMTLMLASCSVNLAELGSVRPVYKIGLIAPFEGLYRRTGYEALAAMRQAINEASADGDFARIDVLPLALDDTADPARAQRAAAKLLASTDVAVVIGPLVPGLAGAVAPVLQASGGEVDWLVPHAVDPAGGFAPPDSHAWADGLVVGVGSAVRAQGAERLILAGWHADWPDYAIAEWEALAGMPVAVTDDPSVVAATDAVFWLDAADTGAAYVTALRALGSTAPVWLGAPGSDPVFAERAPGVKNAYWAAWVDRDYTMRADGRSQPSPTAFAVYQATRIAIAQITNSPTIPDMPWRVEFFALQDGVSMPFSFE